MRISILFVLYLANCWMLSAQNNPKEVNQNLQEKGWKSVPEILARIRAPEFPSRSFLIGEFGAVANGISDCRKAFADAIAKCHAEGGGKIEVPAGEYLLKGPVHLLSNVRLHLQKGAKLKFDTDPKDYLPLVKVRWEGTICYNYSPLIYAYRQKNIAVTGEGTLDGQCEGSWSLWKKDNNGKNQEVTKPLIRKMGNDRVPVEERNFGEGYYLRPSLIEFFECENILLEGFTAKSSPFWTIHPVFSRNLTIRNLTIRRGTTNDDGIDPDSCIDVLIENCDIDTDDDPIAIKAGRDQDAWEKGSSENIIVKNCILQSNVGNAFCIGSEMSGGIRNVFVENCKVKSTDNGINFKANLDRGGFIQNVFIRNIQLEKCKKYVLIFQMDYHGYRGGNHPPEFRNFHIENIRCGQAGKTGIRITGVEAKPIQNVVLKKINIKKAELATEIRFADQIEWVNVNINHETIKK